MVSFSMMALSLEDMPEVREQIVPRGRASGKQVMEAFKIVVGDTYDAEITSATVLIPLMPKRITSTDYEGSGLKIILYTSDLRATELDSKGADHIFPPWVYSAKGTVAVVAATPMEGREFDAERARQYVASIAEAVAHAL